MHTGIRTLIAVTLLLPVLAIATTTGKEAPPGQQQGQEQDQRQEQEQFQSQAAIQEQVQQQGNDQSVTSNNNSTVYSAGASSGDSTAECQQVRDVRFANGILFGVRLDLTNEDCIRLREADRADARGQHDYANTLRCTAGTVREAFAGDVIACKESLEKTAEVVALRERVRQLEAQHAAAATRHTADQQACEEAKDRIFTGRCGAEK